MWKMYVGDVVLEDHNFLFLSFLRFELSLFFV
jgi:hypothetical protein